jgi:hypothetical protein
VIAWRAVAEWPRRRRLGLRLRSARHLLNHFGGPTENSTGEVLTTDAADYGSDLRFDSGLAAGVVIGTSSGRSATARRVESRVDTPVGGRAVKSLF